MNMQKKRQIVLLAASAVLAVVCQDASARNRMYNPAVGRFMQRDNPRSAMGTFPPIRNSSRRRYTSRDPLGCYGDGMNLYQYVLSSPYKFRDPQGNYVEPSSIIDEPITSMEKGVLRERIYNVENELREKYEGILNEREIGAAIVNQIWKHFDPMDDKNKNKFVFTCKYGWLDLGHYWRMVQWTYINAGDLDSFGAGVAVEQVQDVVGRLAQIIHDS